MSRLIGIGCNLYQQGGSGSGAASGVIFSDSFTGAGTLNGRTPDGVQVGSNVWFAEAGLATASGQAENTTTTNQLESSYDIGQNTCEFTVFIDASGVASTARFVVLTRYTDQSNLAGISMYRTAGGNVGIRTYDNGSVANAVDTGLAMAGQTNLELKVTDNGTSIIGELVDTGHTTTLASPTHSADNNVGMLWRTTAASDEFKVNSISAENV